MQPLNGLQKFVLFLMAILIVINVSILNSLRNIQEQLTTQNENISNSIETNDNTDYNLISQVVRNQMFETLAEYREQEARLKKEMSNYTGGILEEDDIKYLIMLEELKAYEIKRQNGDTNVIISKEEQLEELNKHKSAFPNLNEVEIMKLMDN